MVSQSVLGSSHSFVQTLIAELDAAFSDCSKWLSDCSTHFSPEYSTSQKLDPYTISPLCSGFCIIVVERSHEESFEDVSTLSPDEMNTNENLRTTSVKAIHIK